MPPAPAGGTPNATRICPSFLATAVMQALGAISLIHWNHRVVVRLPTILPLLGERAGVRADVASFRRNYLFPQAKHFRKNRHPKS